MLDSYSKFKALTSLSFIPNDLSGNAYMPETNTMFLIANKGNKIWEVDMNLNRLRTINTSGFGDSEGIVHLGGNEFAIVEERRSVLYIGTISSTTTSISKSNFQKVTFANAGNNKGYEGVAFVSRQQPVLGSEREEP